MIEIRVEIKGVYGRPLLYPEGRNARRLAMLTGKTTFTPRDLAVAQTLGMTILLDGTQADRARILAQIEEQYQRLEGPPVELAAPYVEPAVA